MPAESPRETEHKVQHLLLDGLRVLRDVLPADIADADTLSAIDGLIERLTPMVGLQLPSTPARLYALTHSMRVLVDDIEPYSKLGYAGVSEGLQRVEAKLLA